MMKLSDFKVAVNAISNKYDDMEVKVWLPGSTLSLGKFLIKNGIPTDHKSGAILLEGSLDSGSVLLD